MKNKQRESKKLIVSILFFAIVAFVSSCSKTSDPIAGEDTQTASNESAQESTTDELDDMANSALSSNVAAGGRAEVITDDRLSCDGIKIDTANVAKDKSKGTLTITFPAAGCTDKRGNVRKGVITIKWAGGKWYTANSYHTIRLSNYSVNGVMVSATRTVTTKSFTPNTLPNFTLVSSITATDSITWPDKTMATRTVDKTRTWVHTSTEDTITEDADGAFPAAMGTNRHGKAYSMTITKPLKYLGSCIKSNKVFLPISGTKIITDLAKVKTLTIDYGTDTCDNTFTLTVDGHVKTITGGLE